MVDSRENAAVYGKDSRSCDLQMTSTSVALELLALALAPAAAYVAPLPLHAHAAAGGHADVAAYLPRHARPRLQQGLDWLNPLYWRDAYVSAGHVLRNVEPGARVLELGKDAKNLYYIKDPAEVAFVAPSLQGGEGPIREAAAKLSIPNFSVQIGPLDGMQLRAGGYDAVLCVDMLRGAPRADAQKVVAVMARCVAPGGRVVFAERPEVGMAALLAEAGLQPQQEEDGGFMVGVADKPDDAPDEARGSVVIGRESRASRRAKSKRAKKGG